MIRPAVAVFLLSAACTGGNRVPSPSGALFAHYTVCSLQHPCIPEVVVTAKDGAEVRRFQVRGDEGPCGSILGVQWAGENVIGAVCHGNPSLDYYYEVDVASGKVLRRYLGCDFVRSPDYSKVAHAGWIIHFAPPWVQSEYLQVGNTVLYPLPPGMKPLNLKPPEMAPQVVSRKGLVYAGVHEFRSEFVWSPDSRTIGLVDCLVDYRLRDASQEAFDEGGRQENRRCFVVAVGLDGRVQKVPLAVTPDRQILLKWADRRTLLATYADKTVRVEVP